MFKFSIRGTRGTMPACGTDFLRYGGNTTCFSVETDAGIILFDAGTGIAHVAGELAAMDSTPPITMLFTHFHMDHVIGLPAFSPLYNDASNIVIMADPRRDRSWKDVLLTFTGKPYWPIGLSDTAADTALTDLPVEKEHEIECYGVRIKWFSVPHPQKCLSYRVELPDTSVVIATDVEYEQSTISKGFIDFCEGADHLIFDTQYVPSEFGARRGWGHSTWEVAVEVAKSAGVKQLVMTHHEPLRTDQEVDMIVEQAQEKFPATVAASENLVLG